MQTSTTQRDHLLSTLQQDVSGKRLVRESDCPGNVRYPCLTPANRSSAAAEMGDRARAKWAKK